MLDHLFQSLPAAESRYPYSVLIVADDFNRLDVRSIRKHFRLKQIVKKPEPEEMRQYLTWLLLICIFTMTNHVYFRPLVSQITILLQPSQRWRTRAAVLETFY